MSLDTLFKQKKQDPQDTVDDGEFRSRAEDESAAIAAESARTPRSAKANKRTGQSRKSSQDDSALPEKKRARRRLIGAIALVLAAVIGLPMLFESEPKSTAPKISIEIPSKDASAPVQVKEVTRAPLPEVAASQVAQSIDKTEEIIAPPTSKTGAALESKSTPDNAIAKVDLGAKPATTVDKKVDVKDSSSNGKLNHSDAAASKATVEQLKKSEPKLADVKTADKTSSKAVEKTDVKSEPKKEGKDEAARAMALLEGRTETSAKIDGKTEKATAKPAGSFSVQVAAMSSAVKIKELQGKLKAADIQTYTQKIHTDNGEVIRIRVGPFNSKAEAEKMQKKLIKLGLSGSLIPN